MNKLLSKLGKKTTCSMMLPGDKSISIRAAIISSLFFGDFNFKNFNFCDDTKATISCMDSLSRFTSKEKMHGALTLDCKNSATTMRLLSGYIAGAFQGEDIKIKLIGDSSLSKRPMDRIIIPLKKMGASIKGTKNNTAPIIIDLKKTRLHSLNYKSNISSAQVKSCLLLASYCSGAKLNYKEPAVSRNHTEIMLSYMHSLMHKNHKKALPCFTYTIPSDTSLASIFIANAIINEDSKLKLKNICINPTRTGFIDTLKDIGVNIKFSNKKILQGEMVSDIIVDTRNIKTLKSINISKRKPPSMIDEIMLLSIILAKASGTSKFYDLSELKVKESDRLLAITKFFDVLNVKYKLSNNNLTIYGNPKLSYAIPKNLTNKQKKSLDFLKKSKDHRVLYLLKILGVNDIKYKKFLNIAI